MSEIDAIVAWVDGNDPAWRKEKEKYNKECCRNVDSSESRYRDWDVFRYWFRGIEKFAPWIRKIHFVTWGHVPEWLNVNHKKLNIVKHTDFIPQKYLPTFNSNAIELNFHRITDLSEKFIYFNDDMFLINCTKAKNFFVENLPCDSAILCPHCYSESEMWEFTPFINIGKINKYFKFRDVINNNKSLWFNVKYRKFLFGNMIMCLCPRFPGMWQQHLPTSFLKSEFKKVWGLEKDSLDETCSHKFREKLDCNQWLIKEWQIAEGKFVPRDISVGQSFVLGVDDTKRICEYIEMQKGLMICLNDAASSTESFTVLAEKIRKSFDKILPEVSEYEK